MFGSPYVFVSTTDDKILEQCRDLQSGGLEVRFSADERRAYMFAGAHREFPFFLSAMNDQADYSIEDDVRRGLESRPFSTDSDSLVSFAHVKDGKFVAKTDLWGIQHHYFYEDPRTFICSNNCFLIAKMVNARISEKSIYEYIFYLSPVGDSSWFEGIRLLAPGQGIVYDLATHRYTLSEKADLYRELMVEPRESLVDAAAGFFEKAARVLRGKKILLSLSAGSDSRTILSGLLKSGLDFSTVSFGGDNFLETLAIEKIVKRRGLKWRIINFADLLADWTESFHSASLLTNGLINAFRVHYWHYYRELGADALFEGFVASEFVKAEIAIGSVASECHVDVIRNGVPVGEALAKSHPFLSSEFRKRIEEHILVRDRLTLEPIESPAGKREFARLMFEFVPTRVFNPIHALGCANLNIYNPFLSRRILRPLFRSYGVVKYSTLSKNWPGPIRAIKPECLIVKQFDPTLYGMRIDREVSYKEALEMPLFLSDPLRRARIWKTRATAGNRHGNQVDGALTMAAAARYFHENDASLDYSMLGGKIEGTHLLRKRCNLICLNHLMTWDLQRMVETLVVAARHREKAAEAATVA
jgi:hypothetical protein